MTSARITWISNDYLYARCNLYMMFMTRFALCLRYVKMFDVTDNIRCVVSGEDSGRWQYHNQSRHQQEDR